MGRYKYRNKLTEIVLMYRDPLYLLTIDSIGKIVQMAYTISIDKNTDVVKSTLQK